MSKRILLAMNAFVAGIALFALLVDRVPAPSAARIVIGIPDAPL